MTATQPLIFTKEEVQELAPLEDMLTIPSRVIFYPRIEHNVTIPEFCREVHGLISKNNLNSVLIELNTVPNAIQVYKSLKNDYKYIENGIFFLSSQIIPKHRVPRIDRIKQKLDKSEPVILVTTQVIEAGVDLDFDMGVRDIGPLDSIIQAAGRCNRNGLLYKRQKEYTDSPFYIYRIVDERNEESATKVYGRVAIDVANSVITQYQKTPDLTNLVNSYYHEIKRRSSNEESIIINNAIRRLDYEQVEESFQLIDDYKVPVFVEFDETATEIWSKFLKLNEPSLQKPSRSTILQVRYQMENYMVGISEDDAARSGLKETSGIYKINYADKIYDETTGFIRK